MKTLIADITLDPIEGYTEYHKAVTENLGNQAAALSVFEKIISNTLGFLTIIGGIAALIWFILGAFGWISSGGDKEKLSKNQRQMVHAATGLIFIVMAWGIVGVLSILFGFDLLSPVDIIINQLAP
jgi:hypothetical protein